MQLHIQRGEESLGTFSLEETTQYLSEGRLVERDLAWHEGLEEWHPLGQLHHELIIQAETMVAEGGESKTRADILTPERYRNEELLGEGGMGQVWRAYVISNWNGRWPSRWSAGVGPSTPCAMRSVAAWN